MKQAYFTLPLTFPLALMTTVLVVYSGGTGGEVAIWRAMVAFVLGATLMATPFFLGFKRGLIPALLVPFLPATYLMTHVPSNERDWVEPASRTPHATFDGPLVTVHDVRNFRYLDAEAFESEWYDATYDLRDLQESYFLLTTFGDIEGIGHVMVSFRFGDDQFLVLSVEARRERGETYDPIGGAFRQYELMYVAADERDALALRTNIHEDPTWIIPMNAGPEKTGEFFLDMIHRMNSLHEKPEWYNTITSSCSSNLARHYEVINDIEFPPDFRILLPGFSGELLAELELLPDGMTADEALTQFRVDEVARSLPLDRRFSTNLRGAISGNIPDE